MNVPAADCARSHRSDFAQIYCQNAALHGVFMGFFDAGSKSFTDTWTARSADCSQESMRMLVRMAETRLSAHSDSSAPVPARGAAAARGPEPRAADYPVWISNAHNVVGIGAPIAQRFPVMAFSRLGHSDLHDKQPVLRIGIGYVAQQLAEETDSRNDWPLAAVEAVVSVLAVQLFVVNQAGDISYQQSRPVAGAAADRLLAGDRFNLSDKREALALRDAIRAATSAAAKTSFLALSCLGQETRMAMVAPLPRSEAPMAIVILGQNQIDDDLRYNYFFDSYEMTPSERLVARDVLQGMQLNEIANATGLSLSTIRSYLKQIFAKTRTHRQIDLVLLYAQFFPGALRG